VLFEAPADPADPAAGWLGHAENYVLVRVPAAALAAVGPATASTPAAVGPASAPPDARSLEGELGIVAVDGPDPTDPERAVGRILELIPRRTAPGAAGRALPVVPFPP
jgi:hypothetical protein